VNRARKTIGLYDQNLNFIKISLSQYQENALTVDILRESIQELRENYMIEHVINVIKTYKQPILQTDQKLSTVKYVMIMK